MRGYHWVDPEFASLARAHRLDEPSASVEPEASAEGLITAHRGRVTLRRKLSAPGESSRTVYIKRESRTPWRYRLAHLLAGRGLWTKARSEFEVLRQLRSAGFHCPRPLICVQSGAIRTQAVLVLAELEDAQPLNCYLASGVLSSGDANRERFFTALGQEIARFHGAGFFQPDLYSNHIHVHQRQAGWDFAFLDFQRSSRLRRLRLRHRIVDLAALLATLPARLAPKRDVEVFFDAYLAESGLQDQIGLIRSGVDDDVARLLTRRKIWEIRESDTREHRAVQRLETVQAGKMWIDRQYRSQLEQADLANFEAMMSTTDGRLLRALPDRENWRVDLAHPNATVSDAAISDPPSSASVLRGAYLKKHHVRTPGTWLRGKLGAGPGETPGRVEARNVVRLVRGGIAAMRLVAFGEKLHPDGLLESFVLTEELVGFTQLDHFLHDRFPTRHASSPTPRNPDLQQLIRVVATVAAKFHKLGYNHRDLYCCHFFIKEKSAAEGSPSADSIDAVSGEANSPSPFQVNLIDLQRVQHRHRFRHRWLVKDLAQLAYSAPRDRISRVDKMTFMKRYLGVRKLRPRDKRLIRRILAKQQQMESRLATRVKK